MSWRQGFSLVAVVLTSAALAVAAWGLYRSPTATGAFAFVVVFLIAATTSTAGWRVTRRAGTAALGPLLCLSGSLAALVACSLPASGGTREGDAGAAYLTAAGQGAWVLVYLVIATPLLIFPHGRPGNRVGRWLLIALWLDALVFLVVAATAPGPFPPPDENSPHVFGTMPAAVSNVLGPMALLGLPATLAALVIHLIGRYRRADGRLRRQFRWLAVIAIALPVVLIASWISYALIGNADVVLAVGLSAVYTAVPIVIALAVVRPDVFDVDRVLASTALHLAVTAAALAVFWIADVAAGLVTLRAAPVVAVAVTAVCAVLLIPARWRLQRRIDRWLYPARRAGRAAIDQLHHDILLGRARPEQLQDRLAEALHDPALTTAYLPPGGHGFVDVDARPLPYDVTARGVPVWLGGEQVGSLSAGPCTTRDLLRDLADHAAPLVEVVRLRIELRRTLRAAEESRQRLLRVGYEERTRLERDLHDGAQQRLVSLGMALRLAQRRFARGEGDVDEVLDSAVAQLGTAVDELRQLAHGIRPACLDDGLAPALSQLVTASPVPITMRIDAEHLAPEIETTAYYVAAEGLTNAIRHARADAITLHVAKHDGSLRVRISDDGVGQAAPRPSSGLTGLADRVAAHGGELTITSEAGSGTLLEAIIPCASS